MGGEGGGRKRSSGPYIEPFFSNGLLLLHTEKKNKGTAPYMIRHMAEALGRTTPASRYSPDLSYHFAFGTDPSLKSIHTSVKHLL